MSVFLMRMCNVENGFSTHKIYMEMRMIQATYLNLEKRNVKVVYISLNYFEINRKKGNAHENGHCSLVRIT